MGKIIVPEGLDHTGVIAAVNGNALTPHTFNLGTRELEVPALSNLQLEDGVSYFLGEEEERRSSTPKILKWVYHEDFHAIDYIRGLPVRLASRKVFEKGVLIRVDYFETSSLDATGTEIFDNLIVREDYSYTRDPSPPNFALFRDMTITWFNQDGSPNPNVKTRHKTYDPQARIVETDRRRDNILKQIKVESIGLLMIAAGFTQIEAVTAGQQFFAQYAKEIALYKDIGATTQLIDAILTDTDILWLSTPIGPGLSIRQYLASSLQL